MRLSISNIAWSADEDRQIYGLMRQNGYSGLEIAPTRFFPDAPYDRLTDMSLLAGELREKYGLSVCSMQSILYGKDQNLFDEEGSAELIAYLNRAFSFGEAAGGCNFVFGCPRNRSVPVGKTAGDSISFFERSAVLAMEHGCVLSLEANPPMYGTNFINTTEEAFRFAGKVPGLKVNLDLGTMIDRQEDPRIIEDNLYLVNHVHVSEPGLAPIQPRELHGQVARILREGGYEGYVSIEMKKTDTEIIKETLEYVRSIFG